MTTKETRKEAYVEWVTGLDTEPPLEGAFNAGWHARDAEVERLRAGWDTAEAQIKVTNAELAAALAEIQRLRG